MMGDTETDLLLSDRFVRVSTPDLREASAAIERLQGPFRATPKADLGAGVSPIRVRAASCGKVALSTFSLGSNVDIEPKGLEGAILVTTAVRGRAGMAVGGSTFISQEEDRPVFLYDPDTEVLKLRFERRRMEEACMKHYCVPSCHALHIVGSRTCSRHRLAHSAAPQFPGKKVPVVVTALRKNISPDAKVRRRQHGSG